MVLGISFANAADIATTLLLFVTIVAIYIGWHQWKRSKVVSDAGLLQNFYQEINRYWDRIHDDPKLPDNRLEYALGQILSQYEALCYLVNKNLLSKNSLDFFRDQLLDVWNMLNQEEKTRKIIEDLRDKPRVFQQIRTFIDRNSKSSKKRY